MALPPPATPYDPLGHEQLLPPPEPPQAGSAESIQPSPSSSMPFEQFSDAPEIAMQVLELVQAQPEFELQEDWLAYVEQLPLVPIEQPET
ncbi:MAG: hypothetical protein AAB538_03545, partial [Patescibacteria group bacterium]